MTSYFFDLKDTGAGENPSDGKLLLSKEKGKITVQERQPCLQTSGIVLKDTP